MAWSEQKEKIGSALARKFGELSDAGKDVACLLCGAEGKKLQTGDDEEVLSVGSVRVVWVECEVCGHLMFFSARRLGL